MRVNMIYSREDHYTPESKLVEMSNIFTGLQSGFTLVKADEQFSQNDYRQVMFDLYSDEEQHSGETIFLERSGIEDKLHDYFTLFPA